LSLLLQNLQEQHQKQREQNLLLQSQFVGKSGIPSPSSNSGIANKELEDLNSKLRKRLLEMEEKMAQMDNLIIMAKNKSNTTNNTNKLAYKDINQKLNEIQQKLFDPLTDPAQMEILNIEYEKLVTELEKMPEYLSEQEEMNYKWELENLSENEKSRDSVVQRISSIAETDRNSLLKSKPELKLLFKSSEQILRIHVNDFRIFSSQNLNNQEARAIYSVLPRFNPDQQTQLEFRNSLKTKISEKDKPKEPPIKAKKKVVIKKSEIPTESGGFLAELVARRTLRASFL